MSVVGTGVASTESALEVPDVVDFQEIFNDIGATANEAFHEAISSLTAPITTVVDGVSSAVAPEPPEPPGKTNIARAHGDVEGMVPLLEQSQPQPRKAVDREGVGSGTPANGKGSSSSSSRRRISGCAGCMAGLRSLTRKKAKEPPEPTLCEVEVAEEVFGGDYQREVPTAENYSESRATTLRHSDEADWYPTVLLYDASPDPPAKTGAEREMLRRAHHMPVNSDRASRIENSNFSGSFLFLHREADDELNRTGKKSSYQWHFTGKTRRWEARVQGRFRRKPVGTLYTGCVLEDFDYSTPQSWGASMLSAAVVPLMEAVVGERFYYAWGTRGPAADTDQAELGTIVTCLAGVDQVIVCPPGEEPAGLHTDISALGLRRNAMSSREYHAAVEKVVEEIDTEKTYTFCVWGCSRYIDVLRSSFVSIMGLGSMSYAGFIDEWPAHFVLYSLEDDLDDPRHLEPKKRYFIDVMVWSSDMNMPKLPSRYRFLDQKL